MTRSFVSIAPGRLCLFGEHQDYLGLPVVALSLPLYCRIEVTPVPNSRILSLHVPQLDEKIEYDLDNLPARQGPGGAASPDFALAALHEAIDEGWTFATGAVLRSSSDAVMRAGVSTSSAFCVAWIQALGELAGRAPTDPVELAQRAHRAEVSHFGAPGGTMDHVTSAVGGCLRIGPGPWQFESLRIPDATEIGVWVLAYSGEPKETIRHLKRCKAARLELLNKLGGNWDSASGEGLNATDRQLLEATLANRNSERTAAEMWKGQESHRKGSDSSPSSCCCLGERLGQLMTQHHEALCDGLGLSTPRLEDLKRAALSAGAWGFKVVGSGGGGCAVAWTASDTAEDIAFAMKNAGAPQTWVIRLPSAGACIIDDEGPRT